MAFEVLRGTCVIAITGGVVILQSDQGQSTLGVVDRLKEETATRDHVGDRKARLRRLDYEIQPDRHARPA